MTTPNPELSDDAIRAGYDAAMKLIERIRSVERYDRIAPQFEFALKYGSLRSDLKCEQCRAGDCYWCAFENRSYPRCCCPVRLDLNP
jgi:hypothetical protein